MNHRATRQRRLKMAVLSSVVIRPLALIIPMITLPLFVRYLGAERYGLYESIAAMAIWLGMTNVGLGLGLQNRLQDTYVSGDRELARRYVSTLTVALVAIMVVGVAVVSAVVPLLDWPSIFPTRGPQNPRETAWAAWAASVISIVGVTMCVPYAVYAAYQELHIPNIWEAISRLATLAACVAVYYTPMGLVGVVLASAGVPVLVRLANGAWFFGLEKPWLRPSLRLFDAALLRQTVSEGLYLFFLQMATVLIFHADKLIIANRLTAGEVTGYAIVGRVFMIAYGVFMLIQAPLWPAYGEAIRRGDIAWARRTLRLMVTLGAGGMLVCGAALLVFIDPVVRLMAGGGGDVVVPRQLVVAVTAFFALRAWTECQSVPLNSAGIIRPQLLLLLTNGALNVAIALALVGPYGVVGVAWAFPISAAVTSLWGYPVLIRRYLGELRDGGADGPAPAARPEVAA